MQSANAKSNEWRLGRRELLEQLGRLSLGVAAISLLPGCPGGSLRGMPQRAPESQDFEVDLRQPLRIGAAQVLAGQAVDFVYGKVKGYLHHTGGGDWIAITRRCTHSGCLIAFQRDIQGYKCPCHGSTYDQDGRPLRGPAKRPLEQFRTEQDGDAVLIYVLDKVLRRESSRGTPTAAE